MLRSEKLTVVRPEAWIDILGYEDVYQISTCGRVKRIAGGRGARIGHILSHTIGSHGYPSVFLYSDGSREQRLVHRLVLEAFVGSCPSGMECCHNDGDRKNCKLKNLRWDTRSSNTLDSIKHGTYVGSSRGSLHKNAKLTEDDVVIIKRLLLEGHLSQIAIGEIFDVSGTVVNYINKRKSWRHVT